ncbi:hypothetical protein LOAG_14247 [Loa loa]|uniref:Uncharacterized protein n=1 Tax=Loa loa TaxID=7209 RepID=A0A1S0TJ16_LOALO|nr:hypothetical protein LOAG_14247 [Loa loa]EFO14275.2 hypothetical protein LOAG_14247 [Loa loa]
MICIYLQSSLDVEDRTSLARMAAHQPMNNDDDLSVDTDNRQERLNRMNYFGSTLPNYRMKRTASLPNTTAKPLLSTSGSNVVGNVTQHQISDTGIKMTESQNSTDLSISSSSSSMGKFSD